MKKKVLFLFPNTANTPETPRAITILSAVAKDMGWGIDYFDTFIYKTEADSMEDREKSAEFKSISDTLYKFKDINELRIELQYKIDSYNPNIIAISCNSFEYEFLLTFWDKINIPEDSLSVIGGIHSILVPEEVIASGFFDIMCLGEGEKTFQDMLISIERGHDLSKISNTYYRDRKSGVVTKNRRNVLIKEEELWHIRPCLDFFDDKYFLKHFDGRLVRRYDIDVARGCVFDCTYCGNSALKRAYKGLGKFVRIRPIASSIEGMKKVIDDYGIELFYIEDECFLSHGEKWLKDFAEQYGQEIRKPFIVQTRPENVSEEKINILKKMRAPFFQISMGVESGSEFILSKVCNRKVNINRIIEAYDICHKHNIRTCAFFMIGFPYETREDIFKSIALCRSLKPTVAIVSTFQPMPGQKLREICIKEGYITGDQKIEKFTGGSVLNMPQISRQEIFNLRRVFMLYAYLPEKYYSDIEKCEKNYSDNLELYKTLTNLRWTI